MTFNNVYEMITPPSVIKKTWFVDYFGGDDLRAWWTFTDIEGTGTNSMLDSVDGGFEIRTGAFDDNESSINFNDIRHYSNTGAVNESITAAIAATRFRSGFSENTDMSNSFALVDMDSDNTNYEVSTDDGTTETGTSTGIAVDTTTRRHKLQLGSANVKHSIDGILKVTKTTNLPDQRQQPFFAVKSRATNPKTGTIRYMEAYNT